MFWRKPPEAQLIKLLAANPAGSARADQKNRTLSQILKLLKAHPALNLNTPLVYQGHAASPELALTLALKQPCWREDTQLQLQLIQLLFQHGAAPVWPKHPEEKSHYLIALENGAYDAAEKILERGATLAGHDEKLYEDLLMPVFRAALSVRFLPPEVEKTTHNCSSFSLSKEISSTEKKNKKRILENKKEEEDQQQSGDVSMAEKIEEDDELPAELSTPAMLAAAWIIDSCPDGMIARLKPNGAPSVVHALLAAFAEQVEEEAHRKHAATVALAHLPQPERSVQEEALKSERSEAVSRLLHRLWALIQLALAEGSPAVPAETDHFPMPPLNPLCDLDLVWSGVKNFATAWMPQWARDTHCMYHKRFKDSANTFVLAASVRGLGGSGGGGGSIKGGSCNKTNYRLDSALVEKVVGFMAADQKAWIPVV
ncbi:hypothetical protein Ndes2526B_g00317 [Nannochloris sp. 'desiccata']|nr:hypothetical protein KSW81_003110 [Chlorella desiccata (nom. nud.)]KAH7624944.1 hypothetical protein NADE_002164 [Chlorella desiccata (nom. nud.)]